MTERVCPECGDGRGWYAAPNQHTGEAEQRQCQTCAERQPRVLTPDQQDTVARIAGLEDSVDIYEAVAALMVAKADAEAEVARKHAALVDENVARLQAEARLARLRDEVRDTLRDVGRGLARIGDGTTEHSVLATTLYGRVTELARALAEGEEAR